MPEPIVIESLETAHHENDHLTAWNGLDSGDARVRLIRHHATFAVELDDRRTWEEVVAPLIFAPKVEDKHLAVLVATAETLGCPEIHLPTEFYRSAVIGLGETIAEMELESEDDGDSSDPSEIATVARELRLAMQIAYEADDSGEANHLGDALVRIADAYTGRLEKPVVEELTEGLS